MSSDATTQAALSGTVSGAGRWFGRPNPHRPQWRRTLRWLLGMQAYLGLWFWAIILLLEVIAVTIAAQLGPVQVSMFQFATHGALWFPFSMMIIISAATITTHVAQGRTRRSFIQASLVTALVVAIVYGAIMTAGLALEGVVYDAFGWTQAHVSEAVAGAEPSVPWREPVALTLLTYTTRTGGGAIAGLLVGVTYYRYRAWRGTALLLVTALPALAAQESISGLLREQVHNELLVTSLVSLVLIVLGAFAYHLLTRALPINLPRS
ncbi:hypothetical protein [Ruania albidiflava]|uniref:hypothetical protein n=1 Tax=Ruania albidiflava TaxID=366586 RepID=UPI0003B35F06|nr:hypothetical protein [Ruania albidiflava]